MSCQSSDLSHVYLVHNSSNNSRFINAWKQLKADPVGEMKMKHMKLLNVHQQQDCRNSTGNPLASPILLNIKRPLELQVRPIIIIEKLRHGVIVTSREHTRRCSFRFDYRRSAVTSAQKRETKSRKTSTHISFHKAAYPSCSGYNCPTHQ